MEKNALSIAVASLIVGVVLLEVYVRSFEANATGGAKTAVLIVTADAPAGETVTRAKLGTRGLPEAYLESRHIRASDIDRVLGEKLALPAKAGEALLWSDIAGMEQQRVTLSGLVSDGRRAFTVHAPRASFSGLLEPGDRVDVWTASAAGAVVENVLVLAVGARTETRAAGGLGAESRETACSAEVTLSVTGEQGQLLVTAEHGGELRLLLRNPDDVLTTASPGRVAVEHRGRE